MPITPSAETIQELMKGPADTPVVMVNLLTFKKQATDDHEGESGGAAYLQYAERMRKIVEAAGGRVLTEDGAPLRYGKRERGYDNPHFIVYGDVTPLSA